MNIFSVLKNLYTSRQANWITEVDETEIQPMIVQRWLNCDTRLHIQTRWLDKYTFSIPSKMYLSLAWSVIPKGDKTPFLKYIKINREAEELDFILSLIKRQYKMSDNDFKSNKKTLIKNIRNNMAEWFKYYGIEKKHWKKYYLDFNRMKETEKKPIKGLMAYGM